MKKDFFNTFSKFLNERYKIIRNSRYIPAPRVMCESFVNTPCVIRECVTSSGLIHHYIVDRLIFMCINTNSREKYERLCLTYFFKICVWQISRKSPRKFSLIRNLNLQLQAVVLSISKGLISLRVYDIECMVICQ